LVVEARGTASTGAGQGIAAVGNSDPLYLVVSVTDADGVPVSGLAATDFTIDTPVVAPGGSLVEIASAGGGQHGDYSLDVVPVTYHGTRSRTGQRHHPIGVITVATRPGPPFPAFRNENCHCFTSGAWDDRLVLTVGGTGIGGLAIRSWPRLPSR
jgi:hypothetical protein